MSRCLSFLDFFTFIFIFFPEIMLYLLPFFLSFKYFEIWTGPPSSSLDFFSFFRLCFLSLLDFFLCCFSFFFFFSSFLDLLCGSGLLELLPLSDGVEADEQEDDDEDEEEELQEDEEEDLLRLRLRFLFSLLLDLLLSSVLELELDTLLSDVDWQHRKKLMLKGLA